MGLNHDHDRVSKRDVVRWIDVKKRRFRASFCECGKYKYPRLSHMAPLAHSIFANRASRSDFWRTAVARSLVYKSALPT